MKAVVILALAAQATATLTPAVACKIPEKYTTLNGDACSGAATGYKVTSFCQSAYEEDLAENLVIKQSFALDTTTATTFTGAMGSTINGCLVPSIDQDAEMGYVAARVVAATGCAAGADPFLAGTMDSAIKGATITCDMENDYYPTQGVEGSMFCNAMAFAPFATIPTASTDAYWQSGFGNEHTNVADWATDTSNTDLTCSKACTIPEPYCFGNGVAHGNLVASGDGMVAGKCMAKPGNNVLTFWCKSNPQATFAASCVVNANDNTVANTISFPNGAPSCATLDGMSTGAFTLPQNAPGSQLANTIPGFDSVTSAISPVTGVNGGTFNGQWGGIQRALEPFTAATSYNVDVTGCAAATNRADCVQKTLNWWRCEGVTVDSAARCWANGVNIACPTHTNGHRCESSSKKGLLGLLGLVGILPCLLLCLLCCCCLLPLLMRKKKTEGDVHFATFDPHAAPVAGSIAPATACYAPSIGACGPMVGAPMGAF